MVSGILKSINILALRNTLLALNLFNPVLSQLLSYLIPAVEIILGLLLVLGVFIRFAAVHSAVLILVYSWVTLYVIGIEYGSGVSYESLKGFLNLSFNKFTLIFLFIMILLNVMVAIDIRTIWSVEKIIKGKLSNSKKIKLLELLIYILVGLGIILIIFTLLFNFGILSGKKAGLSPGENDVESAENIVSSTVISITVDEAYAAYISGKDYLFLDVRTDDEYNSGHIKGAVHIPVSELQGRLDELAKEGPIIVYCKSGTRSARAAGILVENGFAQIYDMGGGITEWINKGYTTVSGE